MTNKAKIDILLSTYNGEKYLVEQIQSIVNQTFSDWRLLIRDDGSTDGTLKIIANFCQQYPEKIVLLSDNLGNLGVIRSFEKLLQASEAPYIMFCDQDDYWLPEKVALTLQKMEEMEHKHGNIPLLVHTDLRVVNKNRETTATSFWEFAHMHPEIIESDIHFLAICNCVTGCTAMFNKAAKICSLPFGKSVEMHDAWVAICTMKAGKIGFLPEQTIEYRQHHDNVCGAKPALFTFWEKVGHLPQVWHENRQKYRFYHPLVFKWLGEYIYYKVSYFVKIHLFLQI